VIRSRHLAFVDYSVRIIKELSLLLMCVPCVHELSTEMSPMRYHVSPIHD